MTTQPSANDRLFDAVVEILRYLKESADTPQDQKVLKRIYRELAGERSKRGDNGVPAG